MAVSLRGMTWSHPRGYDPLVACSAIWREKTGVTIDWDQRSLQDFEAYPVEELAARYDLIVIDHPHVGQITRENCLVALDAPARAAEQAALAEGSVGPSFESYRWQGRLWGLPIDAATQVQAWRPDLLAAPVARWSDALALARRSAALLPMRPPHSLMCLYTLSANLGAPGKVEGPDLVDAETGAAAIELLREFVAHQPERVFGMDPIAVFEEMGAAGSAIACAPLIYGYISYSRDGFRPHRLSFSDIPVAGAGGPTGSALGGTGIAVSARSRHVREATGFAWWVASGPVQAGPYAAAGGQAGHAEAWESTSVNAPVHDFYRATRNTLEGAWLRPRHDGYMPFQAAASQVLNEALQTGAPAAATVAKLNAMFQESLPR